MYRKFMLLRYAGLLLNSDGDNAGWGKKGKSTRNRSTTYLYH